MASLALSRWENNYVTTLPPLYAHRCGQDRGRDERAQETAEGIWGRGERGPKLAPEKQNGAPQQSWGAKEVSCKTQLSPIAATVKNWRASARPAPCPTLAASRLQPYRTQRSRDVAPNIKQVAFFDAVVTKEAVSGRNEREVVAIDRELLAEADYGAVDFE